MGKAVYNSAIPKAILKSVNRALFSACVLQPFRLLFFNAIVFIAVVFIEIVSLAIAARATDWSAPEQQLARKIVAVTGPGAVAVTVENRSSMGRRDGEIVQNGLRSALEELGLRYVKSEQAAANVTIVLSENATVYVWVAEIRQGLGEAQVVMVSIPRPDGATATHDSVPLSLRKVPLWSQVDPILDVAVLEENAGTPTRMAVLGSGKVSLYRAQGGNWQEERTLEIVHSRPWPRDLRGRLIPSKDYSLDIYLPGVVCHSTAAMPLALNCGESDDPWPLVVPTLSGTSVPVFPSVGASNRPSAVIAPTRAFFATSRNFFTGAITPAVGKFTAVPKFYSAALLPRDKYTLWLFAATDGQVHVVDGVRDQTVMLGWGSDLTSVKTACGAGWQVLATTPGEQAQDSVRAYEFPDRDPVAVSTAVDFPGKITALWWEARGDTAVVIAKNQETGSYDAFRLAVACSQ